jgi:hypothetical protein
VDLHHLLLAGLPAHVCQNSKLPGFRVSLYPSPSATKPIQSILVGRFSYPTSKPHVLTHPRPLAACHDRQHPIPSMTDTRALLPRLSWQQWSYTESSRSR